MNRGSGQERWSSARCCSQCDRRKSQLASLIRHARVDRLVERKAVCYGATNLGFVSVCSVGCTRIGECIVMRDGYERGSPTNERGCGRVKTEMGNPSFRCAPCSCGWVQGASAMIGYHPPCSRPKVTETLTFDPICLPNQLAFSLDSPFNPFLDRVCVFDSRSLLPRMSSRCFLSCRPIDVRQRPSHNPTHPSWRA